MLREKLIDREIIQRRVNLDLRHLEMSPEPAFFCSNNLSVLKMKTLFQPSFAVNECAKDLHNCHGNAICNDTIGSFNCTCAPGQQGNGTFCSDGEKNV